MFEYNSCFCFWLFFFDTWTFFPIEAAQRIVVTGGNEIPDDNEIGNKDFNLNNF